MGDSIIKVKGLGKKYVISHQGKESYTALRDVVARRAKNLIKKKGQKDTSTEDFWALKDVDFDIRRGESIGIIGRNGAGKSTLLKILSRITEPSTGHIEMNGRVASLLEVGTGFHPELTGRENVFLNGAILGMSRREIKRKFDEIVDFSGVEKFLDTSVKRYSSGMYVRLAFAVAAHLEPEILVVDEVLAVGDAEFQKKCLGKMEEVSKNDGKTVLLVSHNLGSITQLCSSAILLQNGTLIMQDSASAVVEKYLLSNTSVDDFENRDLKSDQLICVTAARIVNAQGGMSSEFRFDEDIFVEIKIKTAGLHIKSSQYKLLVTILDSSKHRISSAETVLVSELVKLKIPPKFLTRGQYSLSFIIYIPGVSQFDKIEDGISFSVIDTGSEFYHLEGFNYGAVFGNFSWEYK